MMPEINSQLVKKYREETFRLSESLRLRSQKDAVRFVNQRGFVFFWPNQGLLLPSIWNATAGDRPVPKEHDDPGYKCWAWKDDALGKYFWYYGRTIRQRNAMISLDLLPSFYALSPNYGNPEIDVIDDYERGNLPSEAKNIFEVLVKYKRLDSIALRREAGLSSRENASRFERAIQILQAQFRIFPVGIAEAGSWHYAFIYGLPHHTYPDLLEQARHITEQEARISILRKYIKSVGVVTLKEIHRLLQWPFLKIRSAIEAINLDDKSVFIIENQKVENSTVVIKNLIV